MAKSKSKPDQASTSEQQAASDKQLVIESLRKVISDPKSKVLDLTRAADTLGRLAEYSWFAKPHDAQRDGEQLSEATAKRICDLAERLLLNG